MWIVEAPDAFDARSALRGSDGGTVLLHDVAHRLLMVPTNGSAPPRVWATEVTTWTPGVWEAVTPWGREPAGAA